MKTLIITIVVLLNTLNLFSNDYKQIEEEWSKVETYDQIIKFIYSYKTSKGYKPDTDMDLYGETFLESRRLGKKEVFIQTKLKNHKNKQQPQKIKSTYLDFTILSEENIS